MTHPTPLTAEELERGRELLATFNNGPKYLAGREFEYLKSWLFRNAEALLASASTPAGVTVPDGWQLVPKEPTGAMLKAATDTLGMKEVDAVIHLASMRKGSPVLTWPGGLSPLQQAYIAMLAVTPKVPPAGGTVPEGWQLVPREPTSNMRIQGGIAWSDALPESETYVDTSDACYKAMLAAAPEAPPAGGEQMLREALEPFARAASYAESDEGDEYTLYGSSARHKLTLGDLRRARAALDEHRRRAEEAEAAVQGHNTADRPKPRRQVYLLDCPFCAHQPKVTKDNGRISIECVSEDCPVHPHVAGEDERTTAAQWNRRLR